MRTVPEWIASDDDKRIPSRVGARIFERCNGRCVKCTRKVGHGLLRFVFDHVIALCNGGGHQETNLQVLCEECHKQKTRTDVAEKAKTYAVKIKDIGGLKEPSRAWPCGRNSPYRKKITGKVVRRKTHV
jgi:5-methylcytosine-specific restriction endonuclease McrA